MAETQIRYDVMTQNALRGVVRGVLEQIAKSGLPGEHHLYIAFDTHGPGVSVSDRLMQQYPDEMTIVLQHQFWDLDVSEERFEVKLSFNNVPERLVIPFTQIKAFYDPSVQFGLQFGDHGAANDAANAGGSLTGLIDNADAAAGLPARADAAGAKPGAGRATGTHNLEPEAPDAPAADIVELDAFRKK